MVSVHGTTGIVITLAEGVLQIGIQRPEKKNALSLSMYATLARAIEQADRDESVRALLLHGTADCFTSGNDLSDFAQLRSDGGGAAVMDFLKTISRAGKPIVAAVNGPAVGIGTTMLLHCDLVYAAENATFQLPFVSLGLCPEAASSYLLPRLAGHRRAAELLMLAEPFSAARAQEIGLVNQVLPAEAVFDTAVAKARKLAGQPAESLRITKALLKESFAQAVAETLDREGGYFLDLLGKPAALKAIRAFLEK